MIAYWIKIRRHYIHVDKNLVRILFPIYYSHRNRIASICATVDPFLIADWLVAATFEIAFHSMEFNCIANRLLRFL